MRASDEQLAKAFGLTPEDNAPSRADENRAILAGAARRLLGGQRPAGTARIPSFELERVVTKARHLVVEEGFSINAASAAAAVLETADSYRWAALYGMTRALLTEARSGR